MSFLGHGPRQRATCSVLKECEGWQVPDHVCGRVQTVLKHITRRMDAPESIIIMVFQRFHVFWSFFGDFLDLFFFLFFMSRFGSPKKADKGVRVDLSKSGGDPAPPLLDRIYSSLLGEDRRIRRRKKRF